MGLGVIAQTAEMLEREQAGITDTDKEFVLQFAYASGDKELTDKLIEELAMQDTDKNSIYQKYKVLMGFQPGWIRDIEKLLVSLELYRIREEKAIHTLSEFIATYRAEWMVYGRNWKPEDKARGQFGKMKVIQSERRI